MAEDTSSERRQVAWIGQGVTIEGKITANQDVRIDGRVSGTVEVGQHELLLGAGSEVKANVNARSVLVGGKLEGDVTATDRVQIQATGVLLGDVVSPRLMIHDGGMLRGKADIAGVKKKPETVGAGVGGQ